MSGHNIRMTVEYSIFLFLGHAQLRNRVGRNFWTRKLRVQFKILTLEQKI